MNFSEAVVLALIALVGSTITILWKMYNNHTKLAENVLNVVKENTIATQTQVVASEKQVEASKQVAENLKANTEATNANKEILAGLALRALAPKIRKTDVKKTSRTKKQIINKRKKK